MTDRVGNFSKLEHRELRSSRTGEAYSHSASLFEGLGLKSLFLHHEILAPGRRSSGAHAHSEREEAIIVLEGHVQARLGERTLELGPGDFIVFLPGEMHVLENVGAATARLLVAASNPPGDQVTYA